MGYRVAPNCDGESFGDLKIRRCPVAFSNQVSPLIDAYWKLKQGLLKLEHIFPNPTVAIFEFFSYYERQQNILESRLHKERLEELKHGNSKQ